jgi:hypothetical protein
MREEIRSLRNGSQIDIFMGIHFTMLCGNEIVEKATGCIKSMLVQVHCKVKLTVGGQYITATHLAHCKSLLPHPRLGQADTFSASKEVAGGCTSSKRVGIDNAPAS